MQNSEHMPCIVSGDVLRRYGVEPTLDAPLCIYQLHSPAAKYADRRLRTQSAAQALRRILAQWFVCDPGLGGVVVVGRHP